VTDPDAKIWTFSYDQYGNRVSATDPLQDKTTYGYDLLGRQMSNVTPKGNVTGGNPAAYTTNSLYNAFGDVTQVTDPLNRKTTVGYDANRNRTSVTDANLHQTTFIYDADDEVTQVTRPDNSTLKTGYDSDGNVTSQMDGLNSATTYTYDALNRKASMTDPLSRKTTYSYDGRGNLKSAIDALNQTTTYAYDAADELTSVTYSDGHTPNVGYTYDSDGQRATMVDGTGTSTYTMDSLHRLTLMSNGAGQTLAYGYDLKGQLTSLTYPGGANNVSRTYDDAGRLKTVADWLSHTTTYGYDVNSNLDGISYPNGTSATRGYDAADQLTGITDTGTSGQFLGFSYGRDQVGQLTSENTGSYVYDTVNRLTTSGAGTYGYDAGDNLIRLANGQSLAYDTANEVCWSGTPAGTCATPPSGSTTYAYDGRGNRTQRTAPGNVVTNYGYDQANRLTAYGPAATYSYNGDGLRMAKTVSGTTSQQVWDVAHGLPLVVQDGTTSYVTGAGGMPLEQISGATAIYFHQDQLGSTRALTNQSGAVIGTATYDAYGNGSTSGATTPFGFAAYFTDQESGLLYLRARYYDPSTGQFISRDPAVATTRQPYAYAYDNPLNKTDPRGLWGFGAGVDFLAALGAGPGGYITGALDRWSWSDSKGNNRTASGRAGLTGVGYPTEVGLFGGLGLHGTFSNADSLAEQPGKFHNAVIQGGPLAFGSAAISWSDNWGAHGIFPTINVTLGFGLGFGAYAGLFDTSTTEIDPTISDPTAASYYAGNPSSVASGC
jgi:RHS repeat-associated protein